MATNTQASAPPPAALSETATSSETATPGTTDPRLAAFKGMRLRQFDIPTPAAVLDSDVVHRNCKAMLDRVQNMLFLWRAHIKTHKVAHAHTPPSPFSPRLSPSSRPSRRD